MLCKHFKNSQTSELDSLRKESVCSSRLRKQTKNPPQPPKTKQGEDWKCTVHSCRGHGGWTGAWLVHVWVGARKGLFWGNHSFPEAPGGDPAPLPQSEKEFKQHRSQKKGLLGGNGFLASIWFPVVARCCLSELGAWMGGCPGGGWWRGPQLKRRLQAVDGAPWT